MNAALVAFLRARLDEDEQVARAVTERQPINEWDAIGAGDKDDNALSYWSVGGIARAEPTPAARSIALHIARHDPTRVLAEVEAKRQIIDRCAREGDDPTSGGAVAWVVLTRLAAVHDQHPDYREEWKP